MMVAQTYYEVMMYIFERILDYKPFKWTARTYSEAKVSILRRV